MPISLSEALNCLLPQAAPITETEHVDLWSLMGRVLAEDVISSFDQPPFARSPLDGYALRAADLANASHENPAVLDVIDEICAGNVSDKFLEPGQAIRIMTGAPIPHGADCVVRQENTDYGERCVSVYEVLSSGKNICPAGEDFTTGTLLLKAGTLLRSAEAGLLAEAGLTQVPVYRKPRIALFSTGDEVVPPGTPLTPGTIYDSNLITVGNALLSFGAELTVREHCPDDASLLAEKIRTTAGSADLIVTTGGVSVGKKDILHEVFSLIPARRLFWKIAIKPGMPTLCGLYENTLLVCLSGNPFSAFVSTQLLLRPLLALISRRPDLLAKKVSAVLDTPYRKYTRTACYLCASLQDGRVRFPAGRSGNGILSTVVGSNCLAVIPANTPALPAGTSVEVIFL